MEQYVQEPVVESNLNKQWRSKLPPIDESEDNSSAGLECNICFEFVQDPVVTFCGHLYCWPCIYKWIHFQSAPSEISEYQQPQCPVCKAELSKETLIPLYGRGLTSPRSSGGQGPELGIVIPQRPPSPRCGGNVQAITSPIAGTRAVPQLHPRTRANRDQSNQYPISGNNMASPTMNLNGTSTTGSTHPMMAMHVDMVFARIFGISETDSYGSSYRSAGMSSPRMRRHLMNVEMSLNRVSFFFFCCVIVCLLLF